VEVIGSFASNLWIPSSDIDFLIIIPDNNSAELS
jgi:DNA polymerase sigma